MNTPELATKREAIHFAIKAIVDANPNVIINRLTEIAMHQDGSGIMLDIILKGLAVDATVTDADLFKTKALRVLDIEPCILDDWSLKLSEGYLDIDIKYECGNDENGDIHYSHKNHRIRLEDAEQWGITVQYI